MTNKNTTNIADRYYAAILLPMTESLQIDEHAYRRFIQYFLREPRFLKSGGLCINPEAGEIFTSLARRSGASSKSPWKRRTAKFPSLPARGP